MLVRLYCPRHYELFIRSFSLRIYALGLPILNEPDVACLKIIREIVRELDHQKAGRGRIVHPQIAQQRM
jgi:hypothetical protein